MPGTSSDKVFISYRQTHDGQRQRVREFALKLQGCGIEIILDQLYLDAHPGGPPEGWDKWSSDQALNTDIVIIIGTKEWFQCFEKTQPHGTGLGAACEADDLRHRIYKANGIIENIRVVLFEEADAGHISAKLERYHRFNAERDFNNIVRWLGGTVPTAAPMSGVSPHLGFSIPHNLPALQPFFGREEELGQIAVALDPESRTWGALIDGPGGMGKTSLAVRAAYSVKPGAFDRIVFVSLKSRELDDEGLRDLSGFILSGLTELLGELARELGRDDILKQAEEQRPRLLLEALKGKRALLILDNLESLLKKERDIVFTFVKRLPGGCKAILTCRGRIGSAAEELILGKLSEEAALATLAELATHNTQLDKTSEAERLVLYRETGGAPLLLRWTAGQLGRGHCLTFTDAIAYLRSCPAGNDPLEFVFGDLVGDFSNAETQALCALTYFTQPATVEHIAAIAGVDEKEQVGAPGGPAPALTVEEIDRALRSLANRSLVIPSTELQTFTLVPLVADFLRSKKPEVIAATGSRLEQRAMALILENGGNKHDRFPVLEAAWPGVAPALSLFLVGPNNQLQMVSHGLDYFLNFTGRWDEWLSLNQQAETRAIAAGDHLNAGWRAYQAGWVHRLRRQAEAVLTCADRAAKHWNQAFSLGGPNFGQSGIRERAIAIDLRALGHRMNRDSQAAILAYQEAVALHRSVAVESADVALALNGLANAESESGDLDAAEADYLEALRVARAVGDSEGIATYIGNLAMVALNRKDWPLAESLSREALDSAEKVGRQELIASDCRRLAGVLELQGRGAEGLPYARRAVEIYTSLGSPDLAGAQETLRVCEGTDEG